jgi:RimJ/RimL family protein N-acetyltransferase
MASARNCSNIGRDEKLARITAIVLADNYGMQHVSKKVGFKLEHDSSKRDFKAEYILKS